MQIKNRIVYENEHVKFLTKISIDISIKTQEISFSLPDFGLTTRETIIEPNVWESCKDELVNGKDTWGVVELGYKFPDEEKKIPGKIKLINCNKLKENTRHILMLEEVLLRKLKESDLDFICNTNVNHIPGNISLSFKGISGETLMHRLDLKGIMVSTGSACDSAKNQTSHVIKALGVPEDYAYGTIRISLGKENTEDEIEEIFIAINEIVKSLTV